MYGVVHFRSALDWLNEHTDSELGFFGVEVGIVQIGNGPPAPVFDIVSRPNDWQKTVKTVGNAAEDRAASPVNAARQALFADILTAANTRHPAISVPTSKKKRDRLRSGALGNWSVNIPTDGRLRVEAYIDTNNHALNNALFDEFAADANAWQDQCGYELSWERLDDRHAARIAAYRPVDLDDPADREATRRWGVDTLVAMYDTLSTHCAPRREPDVQSSPGPGLPPESQS